MRDNGLRAKTAKKYKATTNSNHSLPVAPNPLEQNFTADVPDPKWVSHITYIWTEEGCLYLAVVLELYSRGDWLGYRRTYDGRLCRRLSLCIKTGAASIVPPLNQKLFTQHQFGS